MGVYLYFFRGVLLYVCVGAPLFWVMYVSLSRTMTLALCGVYLPPQLEGRAKDDAESETREVAGQETGRQGKETETTADSRPGTETSTSRHTGVSATIHGERERSSAE